mmetsp:Transcript_33010/g.48453  ORF Transcript_33010/g.48453 Transcript_33010/m.48453 type:complete len:96 (-) Transcript_33010:190-477(-)
MRMKREGKHSFFVNLFYLHSPPQVEPRENVKSFITPSNLTEYLRKFGTLPFPDVCPTCLLSVLLQLVSAMENTLFFIVVSQAIVPTKILSEFACL